MLACFSTVLPACAPALIGHSMRAAETRDVNIIVDTDCPKAKLHPNLIPARAFLEMPSDLQNGVLRSFLGHRHAPALKGQPKHKMTGRLQSILITHASRLHSRGQNKDDP